MILLLFIEIIQIKPMKRNYYTSKTFVKKIILNFSYPTTLN